MTGKHTLSRHFILTAADCNCQREMSAGRLVTLIIETATEHANSIGVGYDRLISYGISWVLSRLSIELTEVPQINHKYKLVTWVESINRLFTERNFEIVDCDGDRTVGYARTIWMAIDVKTRRPADLTCLNILEQFITDRPCPIAKQPKLALNGDPVSETTYMFVTSDIDINRHVTTRRYIELITDRWDLGFWDQNRIGRFDVAFRHEMHFGESATITAARHGESADTFDASIICNGEAATLARITFVERQRQQD